MARMGMFEAGFSETVPVYAVNRQCASGLQAIASVAASITRLVLSQASLLLSFSVTLSLFLCPSLFISLFVPLLL